MLRRLTRMTLRFSSRAEELGLFQFAFEIAEECFELLARRGWRFLRTGERQFADAPRLNHS